MDPAKKEVVPNFRVNLLQRHFRMTALMKMMTFYQNGKMRSRVVAGIIS